MKSKDELLMKKRNTYDTADAEELARAAAYAEEYKRFLNSAKTERAAVREVVRLAEDMGFKRLEPGTRLKPGDKVYETVAEKMIFLAVIGNRPLSEGMNIAAAHVDSPRLDLKQSPLYEDGGLAFFKTHYYGGIKKYQWVTLPLALHGVVIRRDGSRADAYAEEYKRFLDSAKTERAAVREAVRLAEGMGFKRREPGTKLQPGDKMYETVAEKMIFLAVIGKSPLSEGVNIAAAHVDSPRLDLKQSPLYEDGGLAFFKTHYYGGIKKYQWVTLPLALHGVVIRRDGSRADVVIGEDEGDPVLMITDLLPHLGREQGEKKLDEAFTGESLNILIGSRPEGEEKEKDSDRVKLAVMRALDEKYGITEEDFLSAELEAVPAGRARDLGLDRSMITAYGHDDRSCAFAALRAILDIREPSRTAVCVLADKEEIGSEGVTGMQSAAFDGFIAGLCGGLDEAGRALGKSFCISADVCNAFDPNFPDVSEKNNSAYLNRGMAVMKYTGSRGKSGSNDASAETIGFVRRLFGDNGVAWQTTELGKVDQGGGGTVAKYIANRGVETVDAGVPVLSMHAPYEVVSKLDCYMTYKGIRTLFEY
jgi:aspartyl aminopeptidase